MTAKFLIGLLLTAASLAGGSGVEGRWMGYAGGMLHNWQFQPDGTFLHVWVTPGSGASLLRQERGNYRVEGEFIELFGLTATTGMVAAGHDGQKSLMGGARSKAGETRRVKFKVVEPGKAIVVDGVRLKPNGN